MVTAGADVEQGIESSSLSGTGQHGSSATLQGANLSCDSIASRIGQTGIEIAFGLQVKKLTHIFRGSILKGCALIDGDLAGFAALGAVTSLDTKGFGTEFLIHGNHLSS